ncbi:glycosyltransferase domain-containing protein [Salinimicrobium terrae]|uniref:glycosyltransferase domain-containing protein n=1 Tax=Salinimicrobium terrae TaxID=470866 RepID=UPI00042520B4|nr:glycosyltransferase domain-containing protein [Salinimicrobium terrae]
MKNKTVIYTAIFGDYDGLIPQPQFPGIDYICFTDTPQKCSPWKIIEVERRFENSTLDARFHKILAHEHLEDYEISIYIDGNFLMLSNPGDLTKSLFEDDTVLAFFDHNRAKDPRNCIYDEYEALLKLGAERGFYKDDPEKMKRLITHLKAEDYPRDQGLISSGVLIRKHNNPELIKLMETWWWYVKEYSKRDQLSFNYVLWKTGFDRYKIIDGDIRKGNRWFYFLGHHRKNYSLKLAKFKVKRWFKKPW